MGGNTLCQRHSHAFNKIVKEYFIINTVNNYLNLDISSYLNFYSMDDLYTLRGFDCLKLKNNYATTVGLLILNSHFSTEL